MEREKFLPIGTIVLLKGAEKKLMITGFMPTNNEEGKEETFDYSGCMYPEGIISFEETLLFNHDQIEKIFHLGYEDEEEQNFKDELNKLINNSQNEVKPVISEDNNNITPSQDIEDIQNKEQELSPLEKLRIERSKEQENNE